MTTFPGSKRASSCFALFAFAVTSSASLQANIIISDNFDGAGSGWQAPWSGGTVIDEALHYSGEGTIDRKFNLLNSLGEADTLEFYSLQFEVSLLVDPSTQSLQNQRFGFRVAQDLGEQDTTFRTAWLGSTDGNYDGLPRLSTSTLNVTQWGTFYDPATVVVTGDAWNINLPQNWGTDVAYRMTYDVTVGENKNNKQAFDPGSYVVQLERLSNGVVTDTYTSDALYWRKSENLSASVIENIIFQNTSQITTDLKLDNFKVSDQSLIIPVPETSTSVLAMIGLAGLGFYRRRSH